MEREEKIGREEKMEKIKCGKKMVMIRILLVMILVIINTGFVLSVDSSSESSSYDYGDSINPQFYAPEYSGFKYQSPGGSWSDYGNEYCMAGQDLILQIPPGGCSPAVVRSDLLEEQNVPVFCKVSAIQINPLIDITKIRSLSFRGEYPRGVSGVSYFPTRAAVGGKISASNSIYNDNLGYLVVVLSRVSAEKDMPEFVAGNITAVVDYDSEGVFGVGETNFYLSEMSDEEWKRDYKDYGFWNGKGYIRVDSIESDRAVVSVYRDINTKQTSVSLKKGETSKDIFLSGFYCGAGMKLKVEEIGYPVDSALLQVNDEQIWVAEGDKVLNGKCSVLSLDASAGGGKVIIKCPVKDGLIELSLNSGKAVFLIDGKEKTVSVGEKIGEYEGKNVFLGYIGQDKENKKYVVLVKDGFSDSVNEFNDKGVYDIILDFVKDKKIGDFKDKIEDKIKSHYKGKLSFDKKEVEGNVSVSIVKETEDGFGIKLKEVLIAQDEIFDFSSSDDSTDFDKKRALAKEYYDNVINEYEDLIDLYANEKNIDIDEDPYAAQALLKAARLSKLFGMNERAHNFYKRLLDEYPNSDSASAAQRDDELLLKYDTKNSKSSIKISNEAYFIDLLDFKKPSQKELSAVFLIDGKEKTLGLNEVSTLTKGDNIYSFKVVKIEDEYVDVEYERPGKDSPVTRKKRFINKDKQDSFEGISIKLVKINLKKQVKLVIDSKGYGPRTESNFNFKIGIEKRAIQLSPEQTKEMMNSLKDSIAVWEGVNNKLGNVIKGLKGACFATSALLTVKSVLEGKSGESMARGIIMTSSGGWNDKCEEMVNRGLYDSVHECLRAKSKDIEGDVEIYADKIQKTNNIMKGIQDKIGVKETDFFDFQGQVDSKKVDEEFKKVFDDWCKKQKGEIEIPGKSDSKAVFGDSDKSICSWDTMTHEQRRDIMALYEVNKAGGSDVLKDMSNRELGNILLNAKNYNDAEGARIKAEDEARDSNLGIRTTEPEGDKTTYGYIKTISVIDDGHKIYGHENLKEGDSVIRVYIPVEKNLGNGEIFKIDDESVRNEIGGKQVIVEVEKSPGEDFYILDEEGEVFLFNGVRVSNDAADEARRYMNFVGMNKIKQSDRTAYENKMKNPENLIVKYFERAPYRGLPAEVPFDIEDGWYVEMTYVLSGVGKPYDESGRVINFYICNVGENGLIEFKKSADDICRYYNVQSSVIDFPGMSVEDSRKLVNKARNAIQEAARQFGKERVMINGNSFKTGVSFGGEEGRCTDFMSVSDCTLLFNVCDPVICPASRCDYGGRYRVDDVIQSGIVGSLLLCLPNYKEGVLVPICLSGVHAGLEGYISILNSTADCLEESLETGRNIGICDEIKSIYLCEFFWRQAAPLMNVFIPRIFESISGQGVRGGGEYLTVQTAWENTQSAINYFTNNYAVNSVRAFSTRSLENTGTESSIEICKSFISTSFGTSVDFFSALIEPDSPVQYHAWFSENQMTSATIPPMAHYKVYYHIYAGKDIGAYYVVYLKDLNELDYVYTSNSYVVGRGYVKRGDQVDEARDFVAVSGYKQLCISINGKEECGFGKVSTSYLLNSLTDQYLEEQVNSDITTEKECIAGTPSISSLINPNVQAGVEETINPELYNYGIIRVCSSENPGKQVLPSGEYDNTNSSYDKWKIVGYCDDQTIECWLDTDSVKNVIKDKEIEEQVLDEVNREYIGGKGYLTSEESESVIGESRKFIKNLEIEEKDDKSSIYKKIKDIVKDLTDLTNLGFPNVYRARGHYLLGELYEKIARGLLEKDKGEVIDIEEDVEGDESEGDESEVEGERDEEEEGDEVGDVKISRDKDVVFKVVNVDGFVVEGNLWSSDVYASFGYNFDEKEWYWSSDEEELLGSISKGLSVESEIHVDYKNLPQATKDVLRNLRDKDYEGGVNFFIDEVSSKEGWFDIWDIGKLDVYIEDEDKPLHFEANDVLLNNFKMFVERLNGKMGVKEIEVKEIEDSDLRKDVEIRFTYSIIKDDGSGGRRVEEKHKYTDDGWELKDESLEGKGYVEGIRYLINDMSGDTFIYIYPEKGSNDYQRFDPVNSGSKEDLIEKVLEFLKEIK